MQKFIENLKKLQLRGTVTFKEISVDRIIVYRNGKYFGLWDVVKSTFVD